MRFTTALGALAAAAGLLLLTPPAHAQAPFGGGSENAREPTTSTAPAETEEPTTAAPAVERRWYGEQTLLADAAAFGLLALGVAADHEGTQRALFTTASLSFHFTAPIIHFAHGHVGKGFGDLGMRFGCVFVGGIVGMAVASATYTPRYQGDGTLGGEIGSSIGNAVDETTALIEGALYGGLGGAVVATAIDAAAIAREDVKKPGIVIKSTARPIFAPTRDGFSAGLAGTF